MPLALILPTCRVDLPKTEELSPYVLRLSNLKNRGSQGVIGIGLVRGSRPGRPYKYDLSNWLRPEYRGFGPFF